MKIAVDAMGGDKGPAEIVHGAVWAARDFGLTVQLVGQPHAIEPELAKHDTTGLDLPLLPASEVIGMDESPATAVKKKSDSSMVVGINAVKKDEAAAFVSAGNSGAILAAALFGLGRISGIQRPALSTVFPTLKEPGFCLLLDVGANTEVRPGYLLQFGLMGAYYAEGVLGIDQPKVALLSNGEEDDKGNDLIKEARPLLKSSSLNFVGNVEGKDIPAGLADVVVTDGFTGNVFIKGAEGIASLIQEALKKEIKARPLAMLGAWLARDALHALKARMDYREFGGAPLLGVNGVVIIAHGRADAYTIRNAVRVARDAVNHQLVPTIEKGMTESQEILNHA